MRMRAGAAAHGVGAGTVVHYCGGDRNLCNHHGLSRRFHRPQVDRRSISLKSGIAMGQTSC
jgi:hypothetical protein